MSTTLPRATIRTQVTIPLRLADGYATTARAFTFDGLVDGREHLALGLRFERAEATAPRHRGGRPWCVCTASASPATSSASERCDCGPQPREAVGRLDRAGGYLLYLRQEGRGIGLYAKLDASPAPERGPRHVRGQRRPRIRRRRARLRGRGPDAACPRATRGPAAEQQSRTSPCSSIGYGVTVVEEVPIAVHLTPRTPTISPPRPPVVTPST